MEIGTLMLAMVRLMAGTAGLIAAPAGRLKEKVVATNTLWWLTAKGVVPGPKVAKADSGTMVETLVEMLAPVEEPPRAPGATALSCCLRAASWAFCWAVAASWVALEELAATAVLPGALLAPAAAPPALARDEVLAMTKAPPAAAVAWVPLTAPPEVEM